MNKIFRQLSLVAAVLVLFGGIFYFRYLSVQKAPPARKPEAQATLRQVQTLEVKNGSLPTDLEIQGRLVAFDKVEIFSEVQGVLRENSKAFKVGNRFTKGALLLSIEDEEARLSVLAQRAALLNAITQMMPDLKIDYAAGFPNWKAYLDQYNIEAPLRPFPEPVNEQEKYFVATRNLHNQYYAIKSAEARLGKYNIYAPFAGVVTVAGTNPGALVRPGQKLGELMDTGNYELEATVNLSDLKYLKPGQQVSLFSDDISGNWQGRIKRVSDQIDANTQTVKVFVGVSGSNLREGMYLRGGVKSGSIDQAYALPRFLLVNQEAVYELVEGSLRLHPVQVVKLTPDQAIVRGLKDGTVLLGERVVGAYEGMKVGIKGGNVSPPAPQAEEVKADERPSAGG